MKLIKYAFFLLFFNSFTSAVNAFDMIKVDYAVKDFISSLFKDRCEKIDYSYKYALYVKKAYEKGFYAPDSPPSAFVPAHLPDDIKVSVKTNICGWSDGYSFTLRETENGYQVISYTAFSQPE